MVVCSHVWVYWNRVSTKVIFTDLINLTVRIKLKSFLALLPVKGDALPYQVCKTRSRIRMSTHRAHL